MRKSLLALAIGGIVAAAAFTPAPASADQVIITKPARTVIVKKPHRPAMVVTRPAHRVRVIERPARPVVVVPRHHHHHPRKVVVVRP